VPVPWHIVLVIDASNTDAQTGDEMKDTLVELVQHLDLDNNPQIMVGVVEYKDQATTLCQLTNQASRVQSCIRRISFDGGSRTDLGIEEGLTMLRRGRLPTGPDPREVLVVTLTGTPNNGCGPSQQAAQDAKAEGVLVITLAAGLEADEQCARQIATSPRYAFTLRDWTELLDMFDRILEEHNVTPRPRSATITDTLPLDVEYIAGSAVPPATLSGRDLVWRGLDLPPNTITLTFGLRPLVPGRQPTNVEALARVSFVDHAVITGTFPVPEIVVLPNASPTASPTATEDETPEPTNTSTPTGRAWPIYLPDSRAKGP
jgi:hypothetical protein